MNLGPRNKIKIEAGSASMTSLVFLLLIFFIIISLSGSNDHFPVDLPKLSGDQAPAKDSVFTTVVITENNQYFLSPGEKPEQARGFELIKDKIATEVVRSGKMKLKIAGHKKADYEVVFNVLALAQQNGWEPVLAYEKLTQK